MNTLLLQPTNVLFFKDGRPMGGSLSGHGGAWPLPTVTNAALHAALHRAALDGVHAHRRGRSGNYSGLEHHRDRKFGSLVTAGPFPVSPEGQWFFPRPLDAKHPDTTEPSFLPLAKNFERRLSSLPLPLTYPVANKEKPSKASVNPWWSLAAWEAYLANGTPDSTCHHSPTSVADSDFSNTESTYGIGIDAITGTQDGERFYSAHYLRLRDGWRLGLLAEAIDKIDNSPGETHDLMHTLFPNSGSQPAIIAGGQQRICTVERPCGTIIPLPFGRVGSFTQGKDGKFLVKWILLSPAVFPQIEAGTSKRGTERKAHPGGWLPNWICPESGKILLQTIDESERKRRRSLNAAGRGYQSIPNIDATLVAATTGKPIPVTGYALDSGLDDRPPGPKPTHLAIPAGSVYYFECNSEEAAQALAGVLNWHGRDTSSTTIRNRRSTLFGEKGFGLGVCGTWQFHDGNLPS